MALKDAEKRVIDAFVDGKPEPRGNRTSYEIRDTEILRGGRPVEATQLRGPMNSALADRLSTGEVVWIGTGGTQYQDSVYRYLKRTVPSRKFLGYPGSNSERGVRSNGRHNSKALVPVNPGDKDWTRHVYVLWFGAYGTVKLMLWANSLEDALDEAIDYIAEHYPGLLANDQVQEAYEEALEEGLDEDEAHEQALVDVTQGGNAGDCILSHEWGILAEDPTRAELLELQGRTGESRRRRA